MSGDQFKKGDVIIPRNRKFPDAALEVYGWRESDESCMLAAPLGGGLIYKFGPEQRAKYDFRLVTDEERAANPWRLFKFTLDDDDSAFEGWWDGTRWNGFATPAFTAEQFEKARAVFNGFWKEEDGVFSYSYDGSPNPDDWTHVYPEVIEEIPTPEDEEGFRDVVFYRPSGFTFVVVEEEE